jgi:conjugal transfer pilus assembly protein TraF
LGYPSSEEVCRPTKEKFYDDKERGWYFNEYCQPQQQKAKKPPEPLQGEEKVIGDLKKLRDPSFLDTLDVKTFKATFEQMKDETIYHPTDDNMLTYLTMQDYMKNKALTFSHIWQDVLLQYPEFNHTVKSPATNYGSMVKTFVQSRDNEKQLTQINESAGIFLMVSAECSYCKYQADIVKDLRMKYSIEVRTFSKDYCIPDFSQCTVNPGMFDTFNIKVTPTIIAIYRERDDKPRFQLISTGLMTQSEIVEKLTYYHNNKQAGAALK